MTDPVKFIEQTVSLDYARPLTKATRLYLDAIRDGRIIGHRCQSCERIYTPPKGYCPICTVPHGKEQEIELSLNVIAAILTLVGYGVNDQIVIFDRVRENLRSHRREPMKDIINMSVNQTLPRTVITAGTVVLAVLSLYLFGGDVLEPFAFAMVRLDGADTDLLHAVRVGSKDQMSTGMRVQVRWRGERVGDIRDIECFEPEDGQ